jgi:hypothetical protein
MFLKEELASLFSLPRPVLTAYLTTYSPDASRHPIAARCMTWFKKEAKAVSNGLALEERALFQKQVRRVERFFANRAPRERGLVVFAGPGAWKLVPLQMELENELHWGEPGVAQFLLLYEEHKPYFIAVVNHAGARFFRYQLREFSKIGEKKFAIDISQWKKKELGHFTGEQVRKTRGSQRDVFEHRKEAQYARLCAETANQATALYRKENFNGFLLVGPDQLIGPIEAAVPQDLRPDVVLIQEDLGSFHDGKLQGHLEPILSAQALRDKIGLVGELLGREQGTVLGFDETLAMLQDGKVGTLLLMREFNPTLRWCDKCQRADRSADPICAACGVPRRVVQLRDVLPQMAERYKVELEVVSNDAAAKLNRAGAMGGWLRVPKTAAAD